ncbi:hypothetical protein E8E11_007993 [Didymella keratinophila]|nr:hypothetical protein E8E11_007993 [Didymella keratinophila]
MTHSRSDSEFEENEWVDTDGSDIEVYQSPEKHSLERKRSLVLAAVDLLRAGSEGRKRLRTDLVARHNPFRVLPREIRDMIYEYMTVPPLERRADQIDGHSMLPLAQTCSQGLHEWREECQRRFYRILKDVEEFYLGETGNHLLFPRELSSKPDVTEVKSLKVTLPGPLPEYQEEIPHALSIFSQIQLTELVMHYNEPQSRLTDDESAVDALLAMYDLLHGPEIGPKHITTTWDCRDDKQDTLLKGYTFELKDSRKSAIRRTERTPGVTQKTMWPVIKFAVGAHMAVGLVSVSRGSANRVAWEGLFQLVTLFCELGDAFTADQVDLQDLKTFDIDMAYRVGDDD